MILKVTNQTNTINYLNSFKWSLYMSNAIDISDDNFDSEVLESDKPVLIDFWAEWCGPCKQVSPILEEIASDTDFKITIAKVNIDENPRTPTNYGVRSIPTLMLFSNGELKDTKVGALPRQELKEWIKSNS